MADAQIRPICVGCKHRPGDLDEYVNAAADDETTPDEYVKEEEGTYNPENGHFLCTVCYFKAGCPARPGGWRAA